MSITEGHTYSRVRDTTGAVYLGMVLLSHLVSCSIACIFYILAFVARVGETVVHPQEGTNLQFIVGLAHLLHAIGAETDNLARTYIVFNLITQVRETVRFACSCIGSILFTDHNRRASPLVTSRDDAIFGKNKHRTRTLDFAEHILDTINKVLTLYHQESDKFRLIGLRETHLREVHIRGQEILLEFLYIVYLSHGNDSKLTQV